MGDQNLVTGKHISAPVRDTLRAATDMPAPLMLTPTDPPYYFVRIDPTRALRDQEFAGGPYIDFEVSNWRQITVSSPGPLLDELRFLESLGLAMMAPRSETPTGGMVYYISPLAISTLYAAGAAGTSEGVFINVNVGRDVKARAFIELLLTYVLPGMFWRNYYVTNGLAPDLHLTAHLGREMLEIQDTWNHLAAKFGWPITDRS